MLKSISKSPNEAWISSFMAFGLNDHLRNERKSSGYFVTLETTVHYLDQIYGEQHDGWLKERQRFDLILWGEHIPFALLEVKHSKKSSKWDVEQDANKIGAALLRWPAMSFGYFVFSSPSEKVANERAIKFDSCFEEGERIEWKSRVSDRSHWRCATVSR